MTEPWNLTESQRRQFREAQIAARSTAWRLVRRHPAAVTSDRLLDHYEKMHDRFTGYELDAISKVRFALQRIEEEDRKGHPL